MLALWCGNCGSMIRWRSLLKPSGNEAKLTAQVNLCTGVRLFRLLRLCAVDEALAGKDRRESAAQVRRSQTLVHTESVGVRAPRKCEFLLCSRIDFGLSNPPWKFHRRNQGFSTDSLTRVSTHVILFETLRSCGAAALHSSVHTYT
jgi:hypothetical protein